MAKITIIEAIKVSTVVDGESVNLDLAVGDIDVAEHVAELLISQGLATPINKGGKTKTAPVDLTPTPSVESSEAN